MIRSPALAWAVTALASVGVAHAAPAALPVDLVDPRSGTPARVEAGAVTHLAFLATWCPECLEELSELAEIEARWRSRGYRLVLVAVRHRHDADRLRRFADDVRPPGRLLWDREGVAAERFGVGTLPIHVVIGRDGTDRGRFEAAGPALAAAIERAVAEGRR